MRFLNLVLLSGSMAVATASHSRVKSRDIISGIESTTALTQNLEVTASAISGGGALPINLSNVQTLIAGLQNLVTTISDDMMSIPSGLPSAPALPNPPTTGPGDGQSVCDAFQNYTDANSQLLSTIGSLASIIVEGIDTVDVNELLSSLENLGNVVDALGTEIISLDPSCAEGVINNVDVLNSEIQSTICDFAPLGPDGISILC